MIRKADVTDLEQIAELEELSFAHPWDLNDLQSDYEQNPFSFFLVEEENGTIVSYADVWVTFDQAQIARIATSPEYRRQGYGAAILNAAIDLAQDEGAETMTLEVREGNKSARAFYEAMGFTLLHVSKKYYENTEDALLMGIGI